MFAANILTSACGPTNFFPTNPATSNKRSTLAA
jgi:hypothetical protein